jgi:hypothetical protein
MAEKLQLQYTCLIYISAGDLNTLSLTANCQPPVEVGDLKSPFPRGKVNPRIVTS